MSSIDYAAGMVNRRKVGQREQQEDENGDPRLEPLDEERQRASADRLSSGYMGTTIHREFTVFFLNQAVSIIYETSLKDEH